MLFNLVNYLLLSFVLLSQIFNYHFKILRHFSVRIVLHFVENRRVSEWFSWNNNLMGWDTILVKADFFCQIKNCLSLLHKPEPIFVSFRYLAIKLKHWCWTNFHFSMLHVYWNPLRHISLYLKYATMHIILWTEINHYVYKFSKKILFLLFLLYARLKNIIIILNCCIPIIFITPVLFLAIIRLLFEIFIVSFHFNIFSYIFGFLLLFFALFSQQMSFSQSVYHFYFNFSLMINHMSDF